MVWSLMSKKKAYWRLLLGRIYRCIFTYLLQPFATLFSAVLLFLAPTAKNLRKQDDDLKSITLHATSIHNVCHYNSSTPHQISLSSPHNRSDINLRSNSRKQLSSTPPGANVISRTSSRHSKSSSDGSFDTPAPSTPPTITVVSDIPNHRMHETLQSLNPDAKVEIEKISWWKT